MTIAAAAGIGYLASFIAFCIGGLIVLAIGRFHLDKRLHGTVLGFTAGLLIAFVCFKMLPDVFSRFGLYKCVIFIVLGVMFSVLMESRLEKANTSALALSVAFGVAVHNIPEGMAVGSLLNYSVESGIGMALIIALHCLPESLAVYIPFKG